MIKNCGLNVFKDIEFPDHYNYLSKDIEQILNQAKNLNCKIITTEKDYFRLKDKEINEIKFLKSELQITNEEKLLNIIIK